MKCLQTLRPYSFASLTLLLAACAGTRPPPSPPPQPAPTSRADAPAPAVAAPLPPPTPAQQPAPTGNADAPAARMPPPPDASSAAAARLKDAAAKPAPAKPASAAGSQAAKPKAAAPPTATAVKPGTATLNLADLEQRLRDTKAIGVFTKLSLKNQVDDLLDDFRTLYKGQSKQPPAEFRQRYDSLLAKVLTLLQAGDPQLAQSIAASREAIWGILSDPEKFSKI